MAHEEYEIQTQLIRWLRKRGVFFCHVPNETLPGSRMRSKLALGMLPGVPDLLIFDLPTTVEGLGTAVEIKSSRGRLSASQKRVLSKLEKLGWVVLVIRDLAAGREALKGLGY